MYISRVEVENVCGFLDGEAATSLDLARADGSYAGWTVFAGRNGAGKTTLLRALALAVGGPDFARQIQPSFRGWIRDAQQKARVRVSLQPHNGVDGFQKKGATPVGQVSAELSWERSEEEGSEPALVSDPKRGHPTGPWRGPWADNPRGWFLAGYGPFRRLTGNALEAQRLASGPHHLKRLVSLFREDSALLDATAWLRDLHFQALDKRNGRAELLDNVKLLLNDGLLPDEAQITEINYDGIWVSRLGVTTELSDLSDGYRVAVALVLDLVRLLSDCYESLALVERDGVRCVDHPGVVLIDEMDAHLHVSWQKEIGNWLTRRFPQIQFLVTSHSPFICQAASSKGLVRLPGPGEHRGAEHVDPKTFIQVTHGTVSEAVLSELFGLENSRSRAAARLLEEFSTLRAKELRGDELSADESGQLDDLRTQLPDSTIIRGGQR